MKPLPCPGGRGPHRWKESQRGIACDRCGLDTRLLDEMRKAQIEQEFREQALIRPMRPGVKIIPLGPPKIITPDGPRIILPNMERM